MELTEYCEQVKRTLAQTDDDNIHMILGMLTEVGELADVYKKNLAYGKPIDLINVAEEVGDLMWYVANFCNINGFILPNILQTNIDKLRTRYPQKFEKTYAISRDLDAERAVLEGQSTLQQLSDKELLEATKGL